MTTSAGSRVRSLQTLCVLAIVAIACFRAIVSSEPFPWWNSDPFESYADVTGVTPALALWLDAGCIVASAAGLVAYFLGGGKPRRALLTLLGVAGIGAGFWLLPAQPFESTRVAFAWLSVLWSIAALAHLCADAKRRTLALALLLGIVGMLAAKGIVQVFVEHPDTVAWYERDRESFLRTQGWEPGSAQARGYERRLSQGEATGWFGLSNIYATVVATSTIALGAILAASVKEHLRRRDEHSQSQETLATPQPRLITFVTLALGVVVGAVALYFCRSKGGMAAAAGGAGAFALVWMLAGKLKPTRVIAVGTAVALAAVPLLAVVARGAIGERISELSLLFRWFYMQGAARIVAGHPAFGVGPAGFRDAYLLAKPPLAVEDVTSPHCFPLDVLAAYGPLAGAAGYIAAVALVAAAAAIWWRAGRAEKSSPSASLEPPTTPRPSQQPSSSDESIAVDVTRPADDAKLLALLAILITVPATYLERALATPETAGLRIVGLVLWIAISIATLTIARRSPRALAAGCFGAAAVLILHSGIEMTPGWIGAQTWFFAVLGVAGATLSTEQAMEQLDSQKLVAAQPRPAPGQRLWIPALIVASLISLALAPWSVLAWQRHLHNAWLHASVIGRLRDEMRVLERDPALAVELRITPNGVRQHVADMISRPTASSAEELQNQLSTLLARQARNADLSLSAAVFVHPGPAGTGIQTARAADRASQRLAEVYVACDIPHSASDAVGEAIDRSARVVGGAPSAVGWSHLASLWALRASLEDQAGRPDSARDMRIEALRFYSKAADLDPRGVYHPVRAARLAASLDDTGEVARWARQALDNHANARLDPLMGLSDAERAEMEALAGS